MAPLVREPTRCPWPGSTIESLDLLDNPCKIRIGQPGMNGNAERLLVQALGAPQTQIRLPIEAVQVQRVIAQCRMDVVLQQVDANSSRLGTRMQYVK